MEQNIGKDSEGLDGSFRRALKRLGERLSVTGYSSATLVEYIRVAKHFCYWQTLDCGPREVDESSIKGFLEHLASCTCPVSSGRSYRHCRAAMSHFLAVLREMGLAPPACKSVFPEDGILKAFQEHLTKVRGTTEKSAALYASHLRRFLQDLYRDGDFAFRALTARDVEASVSRMATRYKSKTVKLYCTSLRAFFRFLRFRGEIELPLEDAVPTVPDWKLSSIPKYLREEEVTAFLSSFDVNTTVGLRDRAMAFLMATAGLRAGEVASLTLDGIDWRKSSIRVHSTKCRRTDYLTLDAKAGGALAAYLKIRPQTESRHVFLRLLPPTRSPMSPDAVRAAMRRAFARCYPGGPARGTHVLRHSLATGMLAKGATFKEIADILRHRSIETTAIYAKVDLKGLTRVAFPWPEVTI